MGRSKLDKATILKIKTDLYRGERQNVVASRYHITQPSISQISRGLAHKNVPWPDGTIGAVPDISKRMLWLNNAGIATDSFMETIQSETDPDTEFFALDSFDVNESDIDRAQHTVERTSDMARRLAEQAIASDEQDSAREIILGLSEPKGPREEGLTRQAPKREQTTPFDVILANHPESKLVALCQQIDDPKFTKAVELVYPTTNQGDWSAKQQPKLIKRVQRVYERLTENDK